MDERSHSYKREDGSFESTSYKYDSMNQFDEVIRPNGLVAEGLSHSQPSSPSSSQYISPNNRYSTNKQTSDSSKSVKDRDNGKNLDKDVDEELLNQEHVYIVKDYVDLKKIKKGTFPNIMVTTNEKTFIEIYIEILKQKLHNIRKKHTNEGIITAFRFREDVNGGHMTGLWLTSNNELLLVNVQDFVEEENKIILYSDDIINQHNNLFKNNNIEIKSLTEYFKENLNSEYILYSQIVTNIHSEINNDFSKQNFDIIYSIKSIENAIQENES